MLAPLRISIFTLAGLLLVGSRSFSAEQLPTLQDLAALQRLVPPQGDESRWATVPWQLNLREARALAIREDKPIFLWRSGGGDVLGRT
jgi:hypothetical protein